jgi:outer membrane protein OmpA-like peptidoglycan-associated protein
MALSEKRAHSVSGYLQSQGLPESRFQIKWYGETQPKYPNDSDTNRVKNRRVELAIFANDNMKKDAADGEVSQ